jgi:uncharacterized SAM-binding protein YcdF (DUF218 family)
VTLDLICLPIHEVIRQVLLKRGVPERDITILPGAVATTYDEAVDVATFLEGRPKTRILVVTNEYHTRRARWIFARALSNRAEQISFVSAPSDEFSMDCWWQDEEGFVTILTEYLKLVFYVVRYGYLVYWLAACGGLLLVAECVRRHVPRNRPR